MSLPDQVLDRSKYVEGEHVLRAEMKLNPGPSYSCPIAEIDADIDDVQFNAMNDQCRVDLLLADGRVVRAADELQEKECFCAIFQRLDCVPHYEGIEGDDVVVSTYLSEQSQIRELVGELREVSESVRLRRLTAIGDETGERTTLLDLSILTEKQREALEIAVGNGYYDDEDVKLEMLATELGISAAAFSKRLRRAQARLVNELVG